MTKIKIGITALAKKLAIHKLPSFSKKHRLATPFATTKSNSRYENSGDRSSQIFPEVGECNLAIVLYQFELERARATTVV